MSRRLRHPNVPRDTHRRTFKVWQEGKGPDLVIEITSKKTRKEDLGEEVRSLP